MIINKLQAQIITTAIEFAYEGKKDIELNKEGIMLLAETQAYLVSKLLPVNKNDIQENIKDRMIEHKNK
jgi:hypothetical protein|tara:strand:+ start:579 stop:785 length:207 start_codon:yes stop_codon:yes gene_type:complete